MNYSMGFCLCGSFSEEIQQKLFQLRQEEKKKSFFLLLS